MRQDWPRNFVVSRFLSARHSRALDVYLKISSWIARISRRTLARCTSVFDARVRCLSAPRLVLPLAQGRSRQLKRSILLTGPYRRFSFIEIPSSDFRLSIIPPRSPRHSPPLIFFFFPLFSSLLASAPLLSPTFNHHTTAGKFMQIHISVTEIEHFSSFDHCRKHCLRIYCSLSRDIMQTHARIIVQ